MLESAGGPGWNAWFRSSRPANRFVVAPNHLGNVKMAGDLPPPTLIMHAFTAGFTDNGYQSAALKVRSNMDMNPKAGISAQTR